MNKFLWNTSLFLTKFGLNQSMKLLIDNFLNTLIKGKEDVNTVYAHWDVKTYRRVCGRCTAWTLTSDAIATKDTLKNLQREINF